MTKHNLKPGVPANLRKRRHTTGDKIFYWSLLALPLLQLAIFYFGVNFQSICMAFQTYSKRTGVYSWDTENINITRFLLDISEAPFWTKVTNSITVWLCTSLAGTVLAVVFAYYIYRKRALSNFFKLMLFLPSVLPGILLVIMYRNFMGSGMTAFIEYLFHTEVENAFFGAHSGGQNLRLNLITLFTVWMSFGPQVLVYTGAMDRVDPAMLEAGKLDGANSMQEFFKIILPNISSTISTFIIIGVASIFTNQNNLFSFLGGNASPSEENMGYHLYMLVYSDSGKSGYCYAAFLGLVCTLIVIPLAFGVRKLFDRSED